MDNKVLHELYDAVGSKIVTKTDLSKDALVITQPLKGVLDRAGYSPGIHPNVTSIKIEKIETGKEHTLSYYGSQREGSGRQEEYRAGLGYLKNILKPGDEIALCLKGKKLYLLTDRDADKILLLLAKDDIEGIEAETGIEGTAKAQLINRYERNPALRLRAIKIHGTRCKVCEFDFFERYGQHGYRYIEVHHLVPLGAVKVAREINPATDMTVLCSNCHRMIHRYRDKPLDIATLKKLIR